MISANLTSYIQSSLFHGFGVRLNLLNTKRLEKNDWNFVAFSPRRVLPFHKYPDFFSFVCCTMWFHLIDQKAIWNKTSNKKTKASYIIYA